MSQAIYVNEDNVFRWDRARLASDATYVNSGSCSWRLKDGDGNVLVTGSLTYVTGTHGRWQGSIDKADTATLTPGSTYWLELTMSNGAGADGFRRTELEAQYNS